MRDVNGTEVKLGSKIAVSRGRRGYLKIGTVTEIKERAFKKYDYRTKETKDAVSAIVSYSIDNPANTWERGSYVKLAKKFVVVG
jgi:hypothetical protein